MPRLMETLSTINSFLRTLIVIVVFGGATAAAYYGYYQYHVQEIAAKQQEEELAQQKRQLADVSQQLQAARQDILNKDRALEAKDVEIAKLNASLKKLELAIRYLKIDHRVARFTALEQTKDEASGEISTLIEFVELNDRGEPLDMPRQFRIRGDTVYIDSWVVKFDDKYVEQADLERGTSLLLFKRIFGSGQKPDDGYSIDQVGAAPRAYVRGIPATDLEQKIWSDFWNIANDSERARQLGIRAAHGGAPFMKVEPGKSYRILLRASGDPTIVPEEASARGISSR